MTAQLTPRQMEACALYAQGLRARAIAERMKIKPEAVLNFLYRARVRMGARHLGHLMFLLGREVRG